MYIQLILSKKAEILQIIYDGKAEMPATQYNG
jgi:hypothetical protein